ncbi:HEAT repeat domain-containing protein [Nannocystaceae bacterium ST9]
MLFGSGRGKSRVDRLSKRVTNQYAQSVDRYDAMEALIKLAAELWTKAEKQAVGSPEREELDKQIDEAYVATLKRFTMTASKTIDDEEEKGWLYRRLTAIGKPMLRPIAQFCRESESIAWALRIVEDVANEDEEWALIATLLEIHPVGYERDSAAKLQMLTHIKEIDDPRVREILARYLRDPDENVRFFCIEALIENGELESREPLLATLTNPEEDSVRLRSRILDGLADLRWDVSAFADGIRKLMDDEHRFDGKVITRR